MNFETFYRDYGVVIEGRSNGELICTCPDCGKEKHFYVNAENGLHHCKICGISGNPNTFLRKYRDMENSEIAGVLIRYNPNKNYRGSSGDNKSNVDDLHEKFKKYAEIISGNPTRLDELANIRKFRDIRKAVVLMKKFQFGVDHFGNFVIPIFNTDRSLRGLQKYNHLGVIRKCYTSRNCVTFDRYKKDGKFVKSVMARGSKVGFFGFQGALDSDVKIMICEAPLKALHLQINGFDGETEISSIGKMLAIGIIGAGNLPRDQVEILRNRHVEFLYDDDKAGHEGVGRDAKKIYSVAREIYNIDPNRFSRAEQLREKYSKVDVADDFWVDGGSLEEFLEERSRNIVCIKRPESGEQEQFQDTQDFTAHDDKGNHKNEWEDSAEPKLRKGKKKKESSVIIGEFWTVDEDNEVKLCLVLLIQFLTNKGFWRYKPSPDGSEYIYVRVENNIIREVQRHELKDYIWDYLSGKIDKEENEDTKETFKQVRRQIQSRSSFVFSEWQQNSLPYRTVDLLKDTRDVAFRFFKNCIVRVTKNGYEILSYTYLAEQRKYIWSHWINERDYTPMFKPCDFAIFLSDTSSYELTEEERRLEEKSGETHTPHKGRWVRDTDLLAKMSALGYMQHRHKNPANAKVVICVDSVSSESGELQGGVGKSLFTKTLNFLRKTRTFDGKVIKADSQFFLQLVQLGDEVVILDDVSRKFNFELLFSKITGDLIVEKKNKTPIVIPFDDSPKFAITTNFALKGEGGSFSRRQFIIEFSDFYNQRKRPVDEYGRIFFSDWLEEDWNVFHTFCIQCLQVYLEKGLTAQKIRNYDSKKFYENVLPEFIAWVNEHIELDKEYIKIELVNKFRESSKREDITLNTFTRWLRQWVNISGYLYNPQKNGGRDCRNGIDYIKICKG